MGCENKIFCSFVMPSKDTNILVPSISYADLESSMKKLIECKNSLAESSTTKYDMNI